MNYKPIVRDNAHEDGEHPAYHGPNAKASNRRQDHARLSVVRKRSWIDLAHSSSVALDTGGESSTGVDIPLLATGERKGSKKKKVTLEVEGHRCYTLTYAPNPSPKVAETHMGAACALPVFVVSSQQPHMIIITKTRKPSIYQIKFRWLTVKSINVHPIVSHRIQEDAMKHCKCNVGVGICGRIQSGRPAIRDGGRTIRGRF